MKTVSVATSDHSADAFYPDLNLEDSPRVANTPNSWRAV